MRALVPARAAAVEPLRVHRQQVSGFMLKHGVSLGLGFELGASL
jgi:transposase